MTFPSGSNFHPEFASSRDFAFHSELCSKLEFLCHFVLSWMDISVAVGGFRIELRKDYGFGSVVCILVFNHYFIYSRDLVSYELPTGSFSD